MFRGTLAAGRRHRLGRAGGAIAESKPQIRQGVRLLNQRPRDKGYSFGHALRSRC